MLKNLIIYKKYIFSEKLTARENGATEEDREIFPEKDDQRFRSTAQGEK